MLPRLRLFQMVWGHPKRFPARVQKVMIARILNPIVSMARPGDIIWVHNRPEYASVLSQSLAISGVQVVLHMHNSHLRGFDARVWPLDSVIPVFCSGFLAEEASRLGPPLNPGHVVHNGFNPQVFYPSREIKFGRVSIAFSGRLIPEKGAHVLVQAMRQLHEEGIDARCTIIGGVGLGNNGDTDYVRHLRGTLPPNTEMTGYLSGNQYAAQLRRADVFCCPSIWEEPFGMVIVEALGSGLPVVASATGGIPEVLQYGGGILVKPSDPEFLASQLKRLASDARLRVQMSDEAVKAAAGYFTWTVIRKRYTQIADELFNAGVRKKHPCP